MTYNFLCTLEVFVAILQPALKSSVHDLSWQFVVEDAGFVNEVVWIVIQTGRTRATLKRETNNAFQLTLQLLGSTLEPVNDFQASILLICE